MPFDRARISAICFDVDGTLSDTDDQMVGRLSRWLQPFSGLFKERDPRSFARWVIMAVETPGNLAFSIPDRLGIDAQLDTLAHRLARLRSNHRPPQFWLIPHARETLEILAARYPLAIVSARGEDSTRVFLAQFGLNHFFQSVVTAQTCRYTKPFPDPVLYAAQQMGVEPERCLMVGDTTVDVRAGKAAGAHTAGVLCGFGQERELRRAGADLILPSPAELPEILLPS
jgi:HAD superfamily hydrolase (TIGR01509 family)